MLHIQTLYCNNTIIQTFLTLIFQAIQYGYHSLETGSNRVLCALHHQLPLIIQAGYWHSVTFPWYITREGILISELKNKLANMGVSAPFNNSYFTFCIKMILKNLVICLCSYYGLHVLFMTVFWAPSSSNLIKELLI